MSLEDSESRHSKTPKGKEYVDELRILRQQDAMALAICQVWHGEKFAWPGHGDVCFVVTELDRAKKAIICLIESSSFISLKTRIAELEEALKPFAEREAEARVGDIFDRAASGLGTDRKHFVRAYTLLKQNAS